MRCESMLRAVLAGLAGFGLNAPCSPVSAAEPTAALVAPGNCWAASARDVNAALAHCARLGVDIAALSVEADRIDATTTPHVRACTSADVCAPLASALAATPAPRLLLRVPVALLDDVQRAVAQAGAGARTLIEPLTERASGSAAAVALAPGLTYRREYRSTPRPMMIHVVEADLARTGAEFVVTAGSPQAGKEFVAEKTSDFARRMHTAVAVNATYFRPFNGGRLLATPYVPAIGEAVDADGLSISDGHVDSPAANPDPRSDGAFCVTAGAVSIVRGACPAGTRQAVGAGPVLWLAGARQPLVGEPGASARVLSETEMSDGVASIAANELPAYYRDPQPRTAIGLDPATRRMWFVVVDGRQSGYSEGASLPELAALFLELGARDAINLDGGGSSTLVLGQPDGSERVVNSPIHTAIPGRERPVANHLGLRIFNVPPTEKTP